MPNTALTAVADADTAPATPWQGSPTGDHVVIGAGERVVYRVEAGRVGIWRMERVA